jgi:hypothetical protein
MKGLATLAVLAAFASPAHHHNVHPPRCHVSDFRAFSARVWRRDRWHRGKPRHVATRAAHRRLACVGHRSAEIHVWAKDRRRYGRYRAFRLIAPYPGNGTYWAIPWYIVDCESHGEWDAYNPSGAEGPYQLLGHGAPFPAHTWQTKMENHRIAAALWAGGAGASAWVCA